MKLVKAALLLMIASLVLTGGNFWHSESASAMPLDMSANYYPKPSPQWTQWEQKNLATVWNYLFHPERVNQWKGRRYIAVWEKNFDRP